MRTCPVCEQPIPGCLGHTPGQAVKIFVEQRKALCARVKEMETTLVEIRDRGRYLEGKGCAELAEQTLNRK